MVQAEKNGFATAEVTNILLHVGDIRFLQLVLPLSTVRAEVRVTDQSPGVEVVSPVLSYVVSGDTVRQAPLSTRNVLDLALL